ncbi:MAG TPA: hypothetical protein VG722_09890, partial [Tepidisphaeraceae bacterium]|nr:hypothetical protein [Tepidisphaeraceae bacterium]
MKMRILLSITVLALASSLAKGADTDAAGAVATQIQGSTDSAFVQTTIANAIAANAGDPSAVQAIIKAAVAANPTLATNIVAAAIATAPNLASQITTGAVTGAPSQAGAVT